MLVIDSWAVLRRCRRQPRRRDRASVAWWTEVPRPPTGRVEPASPSGVPTSEALALFLRHLTERRGRSGRITSPETVRSNTSALPTALQESPTSATPDATSWW
ncbi:hypothetical protein AB8O55_11610 [Saccharopolyspora cebuensis]|uniref:Uncharacterized protein n=1 Tax=Saccharopolyspora cebuensis TaxID=418759 RepID=A0ABV4CHT0_9PSEU